jgi:GntR family transcriptional regulator, transcriptional repressor for pyruvate dehydrogenase complex
VHASRVNRGALTRTVRAVAHWRRMSIKPIAAPRLYQRIAEAIRKLIDAGEFAPGPRLPGERELARRLGVSRTSLREALSALELEGRVEIRVGSGVYVRTARRGRTRRLRASAAEEESPFDVLRARRVVEAETAALAARHASVEEIAAIAEAFAQLAADMRANRARSEGDRLFHVRIAEAGGNRALAAIVRELWNAHRQPLNARLGALFVTVARRRDNIGEHRAILDAIRVHDPAGARSAMRRHLANAERQRLALMRKRD